MHEYGECTCYKHRTCGVCATWHAAHPYVAPHVHGPTIQVLRQLAPAGSWHTFAEVRTDLPLTKAHVHHVLRALMAQGRVMRRGTAQHYEYALVGGKDTHA